MLTEGTVSPEWRSTKCVIADAGTLAKGHTHLCGAAGWCDDQAAP
jgi:hypothetical protein